MSLNIKTMTSQAVERTWIRKDGYERLDFAALFATCDISDFQFRFIHIPSSKLWLIFSARFQDINTGFFFHGDTPHKVDNMH